jgi:phage terminase large subunit
MANLQVTDNFDAINENEKDICVLEGSSRSSKTISIIQYLIIRCIEKPIVVRSFRSDQTVCRKTLVPDFQWVLNSQFPDVQGVWNKQEACYTFENGSQYFFDGCDPAKLHGMRQNIAHLNEVMEFSYSAWNQIAARTTGLKIFDYNPSLTHHWLFDTILTRPAAEFTYIHSTFKDNPFLSRQQVSEIMAWEPTIENKKQNTANQWLWDVYGLGKRGRREGAIYTRWELTKGWPDRYACTRWGYGLDFGYSIDPTALVECCVFQDSLYLRERIYETKLVATRSESNPKIPCIENLLEELEVDRNAKIYADSARPDSIAELAGVGFNVYPVHKNPGSINSGIQRVQRFKIFVHISSQNIQRELENYTWARDRKSEQLLDKPIDEFNHALDAVRYWGMEELEPVTPVKYRNTFSQPQQQDDYSPFSLLYS